MKDIVNHRIFQQTLLKYGIVGVANVILGYSIIFVLMFLKASPELSNFTGYFFGIILSYVLNRAFTFRSKNNPITEMPKFFIVTGIAYVVNLETLTVCYRLLLINPYISQIIAGSLYIGIGYSLSKIWVFKCKKRPFPGQSASPQN